MAQITVVVPARDAEATIGRTLAALALQEVPADYEVIVVDSGSRDHTVALASSAGVAAAVLHNPGGEPAGSRNLGARQGGGAVLAFTDADCEPAPDWLAAGLRALADADIVQGKVLPAGAHGPFDRTLGVLTEYGMYETANLFVRRETFEALHGFEAVLALDSGELVPEVPAGRAGLGDGSDTRPFGEDTWFVWRAKRGGARTAFAPDAVVYHAVFPRGRLEFIRERARCRYFPPLVSLIPELRAQFLHRRWFLSPMSLRFDLALAGVTLAAGSRRLPALIGALPYASRLVRAARSDRRGGRVGIAAARLGADAVTFASLVRGSVHARTLVL